ncbi:MAG: ABC transporter substrate-binding protein [Cumulibacter sp.]
MSVIATQSTIYLDVDELIMIGTGYDSEMINALSWATEQGTIPEGGKIAHIYVDSEYGQNGLMGSQYYAEQNDLEVIPVPVSATDTDMTTTMTKIKAQNVDAIALTTTPAGTASIAVQNVAQGMNLPLLGSNPTFAPTILSDPSVVSALTHLTVFLGGEPFAGDSDLSQEIQETYAEKYPDEEPGYGVPSGYLEALAWQAILEKGCENGDMTREGLLEARLELTEVDAQGLSDDMDLSDPGAPPVRSTYAFEIDPDTPGGEKIIDGPFTSDEAKDYKFPHQQN